jgi:threonylcarbamoyladenosine tRNA methylthiotransferase MtaB
MKSVYIKTLGCKVNTFDSHALANQFRASGFVLLDESAGADVTVINTCSVTSKADQEARYLMRRAKRDNPDTVVVVTGCYAQTDSAKIQSLDSVDLVVPNESKERLVELIDEHFAGTSPVFENKMPIGVKSVHENRQSHFKSSLTLFSAAKSNQTRAFVKIQDGCNGFCSYCLIPYARGASRSVAPETVIEEIRQLELAGTREIVLTGIHIGDYGRDLDQFVDQEDPFVDFLGTLVDMTSKVRFRISSLEPSEVSRTMLELMSTAPGRFCDHFHLPLQSGSDRILKLMRRTYSRQEYADAVKMIREFYPNCMIGADVIPGFPGETEQDHADTMELCAELDINYLHVFPYSRRPNTAADRMPGHLNGDLIKDRAAALRQWSAAAKQSYYRRHIGQKVQVLWENDLDDLGRRLGKTSNYLELAATSSAETLAGNLSLVQVLGFAGERLVGRPE